MIYYLEREGLKYYSMEKRVHAGVHNDGLYFLDDILEDDTTDCLVGEDNSVARNSNDTNTCSESYLWHL